MRLLLDRVRDVTASAAKVLRPCQTAFTQNLTMPRLVIATKQIPPSYSSSLVLGALLMQLWSYLHSVAYLVFVLILLRRILGQDKDPNSAPSAPMISRISNLLPRKKLWRGITNPLQICRTRTQAPYYG